MEKKCVQRRDFIEGENLYSVSSKFEKQQERAFWTFMSSLGKMFSPTGPNWVWKTSDFSTLWQPGTIHVLKVQETR